MTLTFKVFMQILLCDPRSCYDLCCCNACYKIASGATTYPGDVTGIAVAIAAGFLLTVTFLVLGILSVLSIISLGLMATVGCFVISVPCFLLGCSGIYGAVKNN
jgi:hypothetical protein